MYDRLGTLISETLEAGEVRYVKREIRQDSSEEKIFSKENDTSETPDDQQKENEKNSSFNKNNGNNSESKKTKIVYKKITLKTESAFKLLGITFSATADDAKKAYKEKLKLFHPDHYDSNKVMQQIASKKTHQIVEAYRTVLDFLSE